jgi:hypothetical protein
MIPINPSPTLLEAPVAEIFTKLYSVGCIGDLYQKYLVPVRGGPAPQKLKKAAMVAELVALETDPTRLRAFCGRMPDVLQKALQILAWTESVPLLEFEKMLGTEILHIREVPRPAPGDFRHQPSAIEPVELFDLILIQETRHYWSYEKATKDHRFVSLPRSLRKFFKDGLPAPPHSEIVPLAEWPGGGGSARFHDGAEFLAEDLRGLGDGFRRGNINRNKDGSLAKSCLKGFRKLVPGGEFFPESTDDPGFVRLRLLVEFFNRGGNPLLPPEDLSAASLAEFLRSVAEALPASQSFVLNEILTHLRPDSPSCDPGFSKAPFSRLLALFSGLPEGSWVSAQNLLDYRMYREVDILFFKTGRYTARNAQETSRESSRDYYYYGNRKQISHDNAPDLLYAPMIRGMAFFLSALGILEICYGEPIASGKWRLCDKRYLTPFDGLQAVKLTPVGAFVFGFRKDFPMTVREQPKCEIHPHPDRLLMRATQPDPLTEKVLREFMEELGPGIYRLDRKRFLGGCGSPEEIRARVLDFKRRLPVTLPPFWEDHLAGLEREGLCLRQENYCTIYALGESPELARLFATDPELVQSCLRVEGRRVAIPSENFPAVRKRLLKAGYFV